MSRQPSSSSPARRSRRAARSVAPVVIAIAAISALGTAAGPASARPVDCDGPCPSQVTPPPSPQKIVTVYRSGYAYSTPYFNARSMHAIGAGRYVATCEANSGSRGRYSNPWWTRLNEGTWVNNGELRGEAKMGIGDCAAPPSDAVAPGCDDCTPPNPAMDPRFSAVLKYIYDEIQTNTRSKAVRRIHALNRASAIGIVSPAAGAATAAAARKAWADLVCDKCAWDHKEHLKHMWNRVMDEEKFTNVPGTPWRVLFDIWSNIHYGYVGRAAGFSAGELIWWQNLNAKKTGRKLSPLQKKADELKINIGFGLYDRYPAQPDGRGLQALTQARIQEAVVASLPRLAAFGRVSVRPRR
jgi:hypothetical protein